MNGEQSVVHTPLEGETLEQYLQRFTDAEIREIISNRDLLTLFSRMLQDAFGNLERREDGLENLWNIINNVNDFDRLLHLIRQWEPTRRHLLESLARQENDISWNSKLCTIGRLLGSTVDVVGTVVGLTVRDSNPGYANLAFRGATAFGLFGFLSTMAEMTTMKNSLDDLIRQLRRDQELMAPIQRWYQQTSELEEAMQEIFPFDVTNSLVAEFTSAGHAEMSTFVLLATLIRSIAEHDISRLRDGRLMRNLINFSIYPASQDWLEWIILRRHPVILDITRIIFQLQHSPLQFALCQSIPALTIAEQDIGSFPVWGRIGLNLLTISGAARTLWKSDISTISNEIMHIRRHLNSEMTALQRIIEFVQLRRQRRLNPSSGLENFKQ